MRLRHIPRAESILSESPLVLSPGDYLKGTWKEKQFMNDNPIYMEIGMGKGRFIIENALANPLRNFLGVERYSSVLLRAIEKLSPYGEDIPGNLRFLCMDASDLASAFAPGEISHIYLNFSDPWPKTRHEHRRLTSERFLSIYSHILSPGSHLEFKTDNLFLFDYSLATIKKSPSWRLLSYTYDLHGEPLMNQGNIMTEYEEKFSSRGNPICQLVAGTISTE